jgi:hypothetical protein
VGCLNHKQFFEKGGSHQLIIFSVGISTTNNHIEKTDKIEDLGSCLKILKAGGFDWCYFFLDQMEESLNISASAIPNFTSSLRRIIEKNSGFATLVVTLHTVSIRNILDNPDGIVNIQSLAPFDQNHYITLDPEDTLKDNRVIELVDIYIREFTLPGKVPSFPLDPQVIKYIAYIYKGNLRDILRTLHCVIMFAANRKQAIIDMEYVRTKHNQIIGKEFSEDAYEEFMRSRSLGSSAFSQWTVFSSC